MPAFDEEEETRAWRKHRDKQRGRSAPSPPEPDDAPVSKRKSEAILYCHAKRQTRTVGHWFFHTGQWAQCAEASRAGGGQWHVRICFAPYDKKLPEDSAIFNSIEEAQQFVSKYFDVPITSYGASEIKDCEDQGNRSA